MKGRSRTINQKEEQRNSVVYKRSFLIGVLLGKTASTRIVGKNGQLKTELTVRHSSKHSDLARWKAAEFNRMYGVNSKDSTHITLIQRGRVRVICNWFYQHGRKTITPKIRFMNHPIGLAVLLSDHGFVRKRKKTHQDGTMYYLKPSFMLTIDSFSQEEMAMLLKQIEQVTGAVGSVHTEHRWWQGCRVEYQQIQFDSANSLVLWNAIKNWLPDVPSIQARFSVVREQSRH